MSQLGEKVHEFKQDNQSVESATLELQERTDRIKMLIDTYDQISNKIEELDMQYESKSKSLFDTDKLKRIKEAIENIKKEIKGINVVEGVYRGHLIQQQRKEGGDAFAMYNLISNQHSHQDEYDDSFEI